MKKILTIIAFILLSGCIKHSEIKDLQNRIEFQEQYNITQDETDYNLKKKIDSLEKNIQYNRDVQKENK